MIEPLQLIGSSQYQRHCMIRIAQTVIAPTNGGALHFGYESTEVYVHHSALTVYFHFVFQPPHADGCFQLLFRGAVFKGYIWGSASYWSPSGRYLVAEWTGPFVDKLTRTTVIIDLLMWRWIDAPGFVPESIDDHRIRGKTTGGSIASISFERQTEWNAA